jgi:hypothetical protein
LVILEVITAKVVWALPSGAAENIYLTHPHPFGGFAHKAATEVELPSSAEGRNIVA